MRFSSLRVAFKLMMVFLLPLAGCESASGPDHAARTGSRPAAITRAAETLPATVAERLLDEPMRRVLRLSNGFTVLLQENKTAPVVACRVYIKAGSLTEQQYMGAGISHVLEHLVAGATSAKFEEAESQQKLRILGGDSNAYTSFDETCYFITTTAEKWPAAVELLADWTTGANFTQEQFDREHQVVQREIEMGEAEADRTFGKLVYANRYLEHPARHPVIGYKTAFQKLTRADCQKYYNQMYIPDNMIVSIAGDMNLDEAEKIVTRNFGSVSRKTVPVVTLPEEPAVTAPRTSIGHADVRIARVSWMFPGVDLYNPDLYALDVLATIVGGGESSPLVRILRDDKRLVAQVGAGDDTPRFAPGSLEVSAVLPPQNIPAAQQAMLEILQSVAARGVAPAELEKAKTQTAAALVFGNQTAEQQASKNASDFMATGNIDFSKLYVEHVKAVTPQMVQEVARKYVCPEKLITTVLLPQGTADTVAASQTAAAAAVSRQPVEKTVLPNGLTVLVDHNASAPLVAIQLYVLGGLLAEDDSNNGIGNAMMEMLPRGTKTRSQKDIAEFFDSTGGTLAATSGNNSFAISAVCLKENFSRTFDVFQDILANPAFTADELDRLRPQLLAAIDRSTEDWFGEGFKFLRENYYARSPYRRLPVGTPEVVSKLTTEQIRKHYETFFLDPSRTVLAIYGDVDPRQVAQFVQGLGRLPRNAPRLATESLPAASHQAHQTSRKESAAIFLGYGPGMVVTSEDRYPMTVLQTLLGGYNSPGGSILHETLRGQGLVYTVQASNIAGPIPGMFLITALGEPANAPRIVQLIQAIVADAKAAKFTDEQIHTAKDEAITGHQLQNTTIAEQASEQALDELMGLGYDARTKFAAKIRAVTRDDLRRVANKYLQTPVITVSSPKK